MPGIQPALRRDRENENSRRHINAAGCIKPMKIEIAQLESALQYLVDDLLPGAQIEGLTPLSETRPDQAEGTAKYLGYGQSLRVTLRTKEGEERCLVFRTSRSDDFGHDRRADRAGNALLAFDTFSSIPQHVPALDVGAIGSDGRLHSLRGSGEFFLLTDYADGSPYADDLWTIGRQNTLTSRDFLRCDSLADYLVRLHADKIAHPGAYRRAIRDLIGHGEGIFGLIDSYPDNVPAAPSGRLQAIEKLCLDWRFRLRGRENRLSRTHGDFHPFNILFDENDRLAVLDASRGCLGDPADDMTCLSINYVFFALEHSGSWQKVFSELWHRLWNRYLGATSDHEILTVAPPYLAWRALVLANPLWYPKVRCETREALLGLVERSLRKGRFDLEDGDGLFS